MARMIPGTIHPNVQSMAERKLFNAFRDAPGTDDWVCLHSLGMARHLSKRRGEIDFLLLTRKGIFVVEVKGGRIARIEGLWHFTDRYGKSHEKSESPFDQASSAMFALEKDVRKKFHEDERRSRLLFGYGVMFPDIVFDETGCEADRQLIYDVRDREKPLAEFVQRLASFARKSDTRDRYAPTAREVQALVDFLRPDFDLIPSLSVQADTAADQLLSLATEQYAVIDAWEQYGHPRVLVQGGAGTGKTLLALEAALRAAREKEGDVLLLCFNRLLAKCLDQHVKKHDPHGRITVRSIYGLMNDLISASSLSAEFQEKRTLEQPSTLYRSIYPEYALLALMDSPAPKAGMLIVDEAQDMMTPNLLDVMDACLEGGLERGQWRVFCDVNNQASVFGMFDQIAFERLIRLGCSFVLTTNRRNTQPVAEETAMLTRPRIAAWSPVSGIPVQYSWYGTMKGQSEKLSAAIRGLRNRGIGDGRITVLSPRSTDKCCAATISDLRLTALDSESVWDFTTGKNQSVGYCTISTFKGLENDFIILTDIEDLESEWWRSVIYVGMSRARVGLHLILHDAMRTIYETRLMEWISEREKRSLTPEQTGVQHDA